MGAFLPLHRTVITTVICLRLRRVITCVAEHKGIYSAVYFGIYLPCHVTKKLNVN